jgi:2-amino-4-hydroxy-6-hydroxymethyldihydropteridine diphosphokinase
LLGDLPSPALRDKSDSPLYTIYLSLGSNLGDRKAQLDRALDQLRKAGVEVKRLSSVYETEPVGLRAQPWFLNLVVEGKTELFPLQLLHRLQSIEISMGRRRSAASGGPRTIDIDILFYGNFIIAADGLMVPHPRLAERRFVLEPLMDLAPELRHPAYHLTVRQLLAATPDRSSVKRL